MYKYYIFKTLTSTHDNIILNTAQDYFANNFDQVHEFVQSNNQS